MVEHLTENQGVPSSNLGLGTNLLQVEERSVDREDAEPGDGERLKGQLEGAAFR